MVAISREAADIQRRKREVLKSLAKLGAERLALIEAQEKNRAALVDAAHAGDDLGMTLKDMGDAAEMTSENVRLLLKKPRSTKPQATAPGSRRGRPAKTAAPAAEAS